MENATLERTRAPHIGTLDKIFPMLILLCMAAGLLLGNAAPRVGATLEPLIPVGLFLMIYPTVTKVPFGEIRRAATQKRPGGLSVLLNYLVNPLLLYAFGWIFLRHNPVLWTCLILLGIAPCIGMVLVWADLGGADNPLSVALMAWNSLIQIVSVPVWILLLVGTKVPMNAGVVLRSTLLYLVLPLIAGAFTRRIVMTRKGGHWFGTRLAPALGRLQLGALLATLVVMFALKGDVILSRPILIVQMAAPLALFFVTLFSVGYWTSRLLGLPKEKAATVGFHVTGRNFELSIALALSAFATTPLVSVSTVVGPLIEVPVMLALVWLSRRLQTRVAMPACEAR
jgi:ACR3 family arsenite transporter